MTTISASYSIHLMAVEHPIDFNGIVDFKRIMKQEKYHLVYLDESIMIYSATRENRGEKNYLYIISDDKLKEDFIYELLPLGVKRK